MNSNINTPKSDPLRLNPNSLEELFAVGEQLIASAEQLERRIWAVRAQAFEQVDAAVKAYEASRKDGGFDADLLQKMQDASANLARLEKLWWSAVNVRNRAVHMPSESGAVPELDAVFNQWLQSAAQATAA